MKQRVQTWLVMAVACMVVGGWTVAAQAADNPTGTWKWSVTRNNQTRESVLKLKLEGDKLTGARVGRDDKQTPIQDAKYKDGVVSFTVTFTRGDNKYVTKYEGKVSGDTIKGKITFKRGDQERSRDWEAKRS